MSDHIASTFLSQFLLIPDPRKSEHLIKHQLFDMIFIAISASVSDVDDWQTIVLWAKTQEAWLRKYCILENGIPSWWTFRRVFRILDPAALQKAFIHRMQDIEKATGSVLAIDGKTVRRSLDNKDGKGAIHVVSAWLSANRVVPGQRKIDDKSNETTAIPELLSLLEIVVREHWGVENGLHWVLDMAFAEDHNRTRKGDGVENLSAIRRIALNLLRGCDMKCGVKGKRVLANADWGIREKILKI